MSGSIGANTFLHMWGNVPKIAAVVEVITKPGEDGHIRRRVGDRSPVFDLRTLGTYSSKGNARTAFEILADLAALAPQTLEKDGVNYSTAAASQDRVLVSVLAVEQNSLMRKSAITGTSNKWVLDLKWTLILVPNP